MKIAVLAHGTRGDVQPALCVADRLVGRGHEVTMCVNADLAGWAAGAGVPVVESALDVGRFLGSDQARDILARGRLGTLVRRVNADERRMNDSIVDACLRAAAGADVVVASLGMLLRGLVLGRATGARVMPLLSAPMTPTRDFASIAAPRPDLGLGALNRASFGLLRRLLWGQGRANLDELCDALGMARMRRMPDLDQVESSYAFSPSLVPPPSDWPDHHRVVGSVLPDEKLRARLGEAGIAGDVQHWLDAGPAPVYFGFGSMPVVEPERLLAEVVAVTETLGVRAVVAAGWARFGLDAGLPDHVLLVDGHVDHAEVLPRCSAAVHHGGSSTTAAVAAAGLPSVVVSVLLDQSFWGSRVEKAGVGATFPFRRWSASRLEQALSGVLGDDHRSRAVRLADEVAGEDGATRTAELIERG